MHFVVTKRICAHFFVAKTIYAFFLVAKTLYALCPESFCALKVAIRKVQTFWASGSHIYTWEAWELLTWLFDSLPFCFLFDFLCCVNYVCILLIVTFTCLFIRMCVCIIFCCSILLFMMFADCWLRILLANWRGSANRTRRQRKHGLAPLRPT